MRTEMTGLSESSTPGAASVTLPTSASLRAPANELPWGRTYLAVRPDHFRVEYVINPFMDPTEQPDPARAAAQWAGLVERMGAAGASVEALPQRTDSPDMVYAMNLGLAARAADGRRLFVASHMRYAQRRNETASAIDWARESGREVHTVGTNGIGAHLEAGDMFAFAGELVTGYGPRTGADALAPLAEALDVRVRGLRITHPGMYHLDLAFCPLDERRAMVCPSAFDDASARALLDLVPDPLVLSEEEALTFCANSIVIGRRILMPACPPRVRAVLEEWGFEVELVDVSEFHKGGGSIRCMTNPLDLEVGRDLGFVAGGEVLLG